MQGPKILFVWYDLKSYSVLNKKFNIQVIYTKCGRNSDKQTSNPRAERTVLHTEQKGLYSNSSWLPCMSYNYSSILRLCCEFLPAQQKLPRKGPNEENRLT